MTWTVIVSRSAQKELEKFPAKDRERIAAALLAMASDPFSGDLKKLEGSPERWRRRTGSYRIFFVVDRPSRIVSVSAILRRSSTTY
jgi:mRNA interferase RelE/StbE